MVRTVGGQDLAKAIADSLREYTEEVSEGIRQEVDEAARDILKDIQSGSPVKTGKYRKGWKITKRDTQGVTSRIIHNAKLPGLPHLLERGHAKRGGGMVAGRPHIQPAAEPRLERMVDNIKEIIRRGG
jgi:hypothetical protein